jgi:hypothetical protein
VRCGPVSVRIDRLEPAHKTVTIATALLRVERAVAAAANSIIAALEDK